MSEYHGTGCFRCGEELSDDPESNYGYCDSCKNTCPVCDGTGKAMGRILGGSVDIPEEELTIPVVLKSLARLIEDVIGQGGSIHNFGIYPNSNQIRIRVVGHKFVRTEEEAETLKVFEAGLSIT